jgi:hypothetical protein
VCRRLTTLAFEETSQLHLIGHFAFAYSPILESCSFR